MPMQANEIEALLRETFPDAEIQVGGDDGVHMSASVVDESFRGLPGISCATTMTWFTRRPICLTVGWP